MKIIEYRGALDIDVQFNDDFNTIVTNKQYNDFKKGSIKNPNYKSVCGVGYLGQGTHGAKTDEDAYRTWKHMIERCYDSKLHEKYSSYKDCYVCEEWHCFQNFAEWYNQNYYEIINQRMALDKDILYKNNKIYSESTCIFVPQSINSLFIKANSTRGNLPIGVHLCCRKNKNKYQAQCGDGSGNSVHLGFYDSIEEAFYEYKKYKEQLIKQLADIYYIDGLIPKKLYIAMYNYEVGIDD